MSGLGCGIGVGLGGSRRMTPAGLAAALTSIYGAALVGLWIGEDLVVDGSNNVTSWPGRVGVARSNVNANRFLRSVLNGRAGILNATQTGKALGAADTIVTKSLLLVSSPSVLPVPNATYIANCSGLSAPPLDILGGFSALHVGPSYGGERYVNGVQTTTLAGATLQTMEAASTTNAANSLYLGGIGDGFQLYDYLGFIGMARRLNAVPTAPQRAAELAALQAYYGIA